MLNGSSRRDLTRKFSVISRQSMEGICHRGIVSESAPRGLRRLKVVRKRKVPVDEASAADVERVCESFQQ